MVARRTGEEVEMRIFRNIGIFLAVCAFLYSSPAGAAVSGIHRVASGLSSPIFATHAPGDRSRLFIAERGGGIRVLNLNTGTLLPTPFLSMTGIDQNGEGGFLGLAFHPDYFDPDADGFGKFYVKVTTPGSALTARIREFTVSTTDPNVANAGSLRELLSYTNPQSNHVGGWIGFSPNDNYLYIANGDGGGGNDSGTGHVSGGNAQNVEANWLGKMLRIDPIDPDPSSGLNYTIPPTNPFVSGPGLDEIWSYGLRNPFRASFDRITGDLYIGDVGQDNREEVDFQAASDLGGDNYGWRLREGDIATPTGGVGGPPPANHVPPVYSYTHPDTTVPPVSPAQYAGNLITGGYVYRGPDPSLQGKYFFLDAGGNNNWMADTTPFTSVTNIDSLLTPNVGSASFPVSFGEDAVGNLYIVYNGSGEVYRINTTQLLRGDFDADGDVDNADYTRWRAGLGSANPNPASDGNGNSVFDAADYVAWRMNLGASVHAGAGAGSVPAVPEPLSSIIIAQTAALLGISTRFRRRRRMTAIDS
jgi:glucose/arabinose dehydrogenase